MPDQPSASVRARAAELLRELEPLIDRLGDLTDWRDAEELARKPELLDSVEQAITALRELA